MTFTNNGTITPGTATFDFELKPASTAAEVAAVWQTALSMSAVYTITKASPETVALTVESVSAENGFLSVTVSGRNLKDAYFLSKCSANVRLGISDGNNDLITGYIPMAPVEVIDFEDPMFKSYCVDKFDTDCDGEISITEAKSITDIDASSLGLTSLKGIEFFSNLQTVDVSLNELTSIDLSNSPKLSDIYVNGNNLQQLDFSGLSALQVLDCSENAELGVIDLTKIVGLKSLNVSGCTGMNNIDVTANEKLETLSATGTSLEILDVSKNSKLSKLDLSTSVMLLVSAGMNSSIYQVGQYVSIDNVLGVVFFNESSVVKAVSVDETETVYGYYQKKTYATSETDGVANTNQIVSVSPAAKWCRDKDSAWYLPALNELKDVYNNKSKLNETLSSPAVNGTRLGASAYWSSTEDAYNYAYTIGFASGKTNQSSENNSYCVRAVRAL